MRQLRVYSIVACVASLSAAGCGGAHSNAGLPTTGSPDDVVGKTSTRTITEYKIPRQDKIKVKAFPIGITTGPDGAIWFAERGWGKLGRITTDGVITNQFSLEVKGQGPSFHPQRVVTGPDGRLWATCGTNRTFRQENHGDRDPYGSIRWMTASGKVNVLQLHTMYSDPRAITPGSDGNLWFTESRGAIGEITTGGTLLNEIAVRHSNRVYPIAVGPNGNIWFGELFNNRLGEVALPYEPNEALEYFTLPKNAGPDGIAAGPSGDPHLYISERLVDKIGKVDISGTLIDEYQLPRGSAPTAITVGSDGNLYVAELGIGSIAEIILTGSMAGNIIQFPTPTPKSGPWGVVSGPDGNIWFTEALTGKIGKLPIPR